MAASVIEIPLDQIDVTDRLREPEEAEIAKLAASMQVDGKKRLIQPITVRPARDGIYKLVTGAHRVAAAKSLGWTTIAAIVESKMTDDDARIREIDENLHRAELSPYDQAEFITMRWRLWLRRKDQRDELPKLLDLSQRHESAEFYRDTAGLAGLSTETIRLAVRRRLHLNEVWEDLKGTDATQKGVVLDRLRKLKIRIGDVVRAAADHGGSVEAALQAEIETEQVRKNKSSISANQALKNLHKAWRICPPQAREKFLELLRAEGAIK